jgi:hypothetical protein
MLDSIVKAREKAAQTYHDSLTKQIDKAKIQREKIAVKLAAVDAIITGIEEEIARASKL